MGEVGKKEYQVWQVGKEEYQVWQVGNDVPADVMAATEQVGKGVEDLICGLVNREVVEHLSHPHDCTEACHSETVARFVMDTIPESQARFMAMYAIKMLGVIFLADNPDSIRGTDD
jgi:hypothetical protein